VKALEGLQAEPYMPKPEVLRPAGMVAGSFGGEVLRPDEASRCSAELDVGLLLALVRCFWRRVQAGSTVL
jgi:hypothetical protein